MSWVTVGVTVDSALLGGREKKKQKKRTGRQEAEISEFEADRQRRIDETRGLIDRSFGSQRRQNQYDDYVGALREYLGTELVRQKADASRQTKFALARAGQTGGSVASDTMAKLGDEYSRGALQNESTVQGSLAGLRDQDEIARTRLLALADSGMDLTTAARRTSEMQEASIGRARNESFAKGLGDVFEKTAGTYKAINERVAQRRGFGYKANRQDLYG